jgi:hypothetical protein
MTQSTIDCSAQGGRSITFQGNTLDQLHGTSFAAFTNTQATKSASAESGAGDFGQDLVDNDGDPSDESRRKQFESPAGTGNDCLQQLLKLQSDLSQVISVSRDPDPYSRPDSETQFPPGMPSSSPENVKKSSLDIIFGATQTLTDILRGSSSSNLPGAQFHERLTPASQEDEDACSSPSSGADTVTTLLILACSSSLLAAYDKLVASLVELPTNSTTKPDLQVPSLSPSLNFGAFKMTAKSTLYVSTLLRVVKQMLDQLQDTLSRRFPLSNNTPGVTPSLELNSSFTGMSEESSAAPRISSPLISAAQAVLADITAKEKHLTEILVTK